MKRTYPKILRNRKVVRGFPWDFVGRLRTVNLLEVPVGERPALRDGKKAG